MLGTLLSDREENLHELCFCTQKAHGLILTTVSAVTGMHAWDHLHTERKKHQCVSMRLLIYQGLPRQWAQWAQC